MKRIVFLYLILIAILAAVIFFRSGFFNRQPSIKSDEPQISIDSKNFKLLLAKSEDEQIKGLSNREAIDQNTGMLFIFKEKDFYPFWMKNMKFPIDIIYISDNKVVDIYQNVKPQENETDTSKIRIYRPKEKANYVLEMNAGKAKENNIKIGDEVAIKNID